MMPSYRAPAATTLNVMEPGREGSRKPQNPVPKAKPKLR